MKIALDKIAEQVKKAKFLANKMAEGMTFEQAVAAYEARG
jgi:hypothetical protein